MSNVYENIYLGSVEIGQVFQGVDLVWQHGYTISKTLIITYYGVADLNLEVYK